MVIRLKSLEALSDDMLHLDVLRFVASMAIVAYHFAGQLQLSEGWGRTLAPLWRLSLAVDLFFFISGFVISRFYRDVLGGERYGSFIWKRIARLYPLHLATTLFYVAAGIGLAALRVPLRTPEQFDMACLPANLLLLHSIGACPHPSFDEASWSISAEMLIYLAFPLVTLLRRMQPLVPVLGLGLLAWLELTASGGSARPWYGWTYDDGLLRAIPSFLLGAAAFDYRHRIADLKMAEPAMWLLLAIALGATLLALPGFLVVVLLYLSCLAAIAADGRRESSRLVSRAAPLGILTYSIYLLHPIVGFVMLTFIGNKLLGLGGTAMNLWVAAAIPVTLALAYLSFTWFEDPARRWLSHAGLRRPAPADLHTPI